MKNWFQAFAFKWVNLHRYRVGRVQVPALGAVQEDVRGGHPPGRGGRSLVGLVGFSQRHIKPLVADCQAKRALITTAKSRATQTCNERRKSEKQSADALPRYKPDKSGIQFS